MFFAVVRLGMLFGVVLEGVGVVGGGDVVGDVVGDAVASWCYAAREAALRFAFAFFLVVVSFS